MQASLDPRPDNLLVQRCRAGDTTAAEALFRRYHALAYGVVVRMLPGSPRTEPLVQQIFLKAFKGLNGWNGEFRVWICRMALRTCLDVLAREPLRPGAEPGEPLPEVYRRLERALARLAPEERALVVAHDLIELSYAEVSQALELDPADVPGQLARARRQLIKHATNSS